MLKIASTLSEGQACIGTRTIDAGNSKLGLTFRSEDRTGKEFMGRLLLFLLHTTLDRSRVFEHWINSQFPSLSTRV